MQDVQTLVTRYLDAFNEDGRIRNVYGFTDVGSAT